MARININKKNAEVFMENFNKAIYSAPKTPMFFKDEGGFYITKFEPDGTPADPNKMYEFGTLVEELVPNKKQAMKFAKDRGCVAVFG